MEKTLFENKIVEIDYTELEIGDHLVTERGRYTHHGIYIGEGKVIHYAGLSEDGKKTGPIEEVNIYDFTNGKLCSVRNYELKEKPFNREKVVKRAKSRLGENTYHVLYNNCEHFAEWCWINKGISKQVLAAMINVVAIIPPPADSPDTFTDVMMRPAAESISNILTNKSMDNIPNLKKPYFYVKKI
ncbi:TPA: lecithin retinol acyltransferase family protein [Bacillus wiedmannii]|nr:lecithin retinol acyltransferase family protein [Bacillus wiedmannii]